MALGGYYGFLFHLYINGKKNHISFVFCGIYPTSFTFFYYLCTDLITVER